MEEKLDLILNELKELKTEIKSIKESQKEAKADLTKVKKIVTILSDHAGEASKDRRSLLQSQKDLHKKFDRLKARQEINTATIKENILRIEDLEGSFEPEEA